MPREAYELDELSERAAIESVGQGAVDTSEGELWKCAVAGLAVRNRARIARLIDDLSYGFATALSRSGITTPIQLAMMGDLTVSELEAEAQDIFDATNKQIVDME